MKKVVSELKRTLSLALAFLMVATSVPQAAMSVFAEEAANVAEDVSISENSVSDNSLVVTYATDRIYVPAGKNVSVKAPAVTSWGAKTKAQFSLVGNEDSNVTINPANGKITIKKGNKVSANTVIKVLAQKEGDITTTRVVELVASNEELTGEVALLKINRDEDYNIVSYSKVSENKISISANSYAVKVIKKGVDAKKAEFTADDFVSNASYTVKMPSAKIVSGSADSFYFVGANKKVKFTVKANDGSKSFKPAPITVATEFKAIADMSKLVLNLNTDDLLSYERISENSISANNATPVEVNASLATRNWVSAYIIDGDISEHSISLSFKNASVLKKIGGFAFKPKKDTVVITVKDNVSKQKATFTVKNTNIGTTAAAKAKVKVVKGASLTANVWAPQSIDFTVENAKDGDKVIFDADPVKYNAGVSKKGNKYANFVYRISENSISGNTVKGGKVTLDFDTTEYAITATGSYQLYATVVGADGKITQAPVAVKVPVKAPKADKITAKLNGKVAISSNSVSANGTAALKITKKGAAASISNNQIVGAPRVSNAIVKGQINKFTEAFKVQFDPNKGFIVTVKDEKLAADKNNQVGFVSFEAAGGYSTTFKKLINWKNQKVKITVKFPKAK